MVGWGTDLVGRKSHSVTKLGTDIYLPYGIICLAWPRSVLAEGVHMALDNQCEIQNANITVISWEKGLTVIWFGMKSVVLLGREAISQRKQFKIGSQHDNVDAAAPTDAAHDPR